MLPNAHWHNVLGNNNSANYASRGVTPQQLKDHQFWKKGLEWLARHSTSWPLSTWTIGRGGDFEKQPIAATTIISSPLTWDLLDRHSSSTRLCRVTPTCRRVFPRWSLLVQPLAPQDLDVGTQFRTKSVQHAHFDAEVKLLAKGISLPSTNAICQLILFLNKESGVYCLREWLHNTLLDPDATYPMILLRTEPFTTMIIAQAPYQNMLHSGTQVMIAYLGRAYWILGGRVPVCSSILRCVRCVRHQGITAQQLMGQHPTRRITPSKPFLHACVNYAGSSISRLWHTTRRTNL